MIQELLDLRKKILLLPIKNNLVCFLIYGSILTNSGDANDFDAIVIVKKIDSTLNSLFKILSTRYDKLDVNIYTQEEVLNNLSFYTREFKLEYLAEGLCLYGKNILRDEYSKVSEYKYKRSMLIRSIERLQIVRQKYFLTSIGSQNKLDYLKKYFLRISKSILILHGAENNSSVNGLNQNKINKKLFAVGVSDILLNTDKIKAADEYLKLFNILSKALIKCKKELNLK